MFLKLFQRKRKRSMSVEFNELKAKYELFQSLVVAVLTEKDAKIADLTAKLEAASTTVPVSDPTPAEVLAVTAEVNAAIAALPATSALADMGGLVHPALA